MPRDNTQSFAVQTSWNACCSQKTRIHRYPAVPSWAAPYVQGKTIGLRARRSGPGVGHAALLMVLAAWFALTGCGSGGYAGSGIISLSSSTVVIDAGQSFSNNRGALGRCASVVDDLRRRMLCGCLRLSFEHDRVFGYLYGPSRHCEPDESDFDGGDERDR